MGLTYCRNTMYKEVYWHKTVRCFMAMFKRAFFEYTKWVDIKSKKELLQNASDELFLEEIHMVLSTKKSEAANLLSVFKGGKRSPHKNIFSFQKNDKTPPADVVTFCERVLAYTEYSELLRMTDCLAKSIARSPSLPPGVAEPLQLGAFDILIEVTPGKTDAELDYAPDESWMFNERTGSEANSEAEASVLRSLAEYLPSSYQVFVYSSPHIAPLLSTILANEEACEEIFAEAMRLLDRR